MPITLILGSYWVRLLFSVSCYCNKFDLVFFRVNQFSDHVRGLTSIRLIYLGVDLSVAPKSFLSLSLIWIITDVWKWWMIMLCSYDSLTSLIVAFTVDQNVTVDVQHRLFIFCNGRYEISYLWFWYCTWFILYNLQKKMLIYYRVKEESSFKFFKWLKMRWQGGLLQNTIK